MGADNRPFHDHPGFTGPCSKEKHNLIITGINPYKVGINKDTGRIENALVAFFESFGYALEYSRKRDGKFYCACCRVEL